MIKYAFTSKLLTGLVLGSALVLAGCTPSEEGNGTQENPMLAPSPCSGGSNADQSMCEMLGWGMSFDFFGNKYAPTVASLVNFSSFSFNLNGSTVVFPANGNFTLSLKNSAGQTVAASSFGWVKQGNNLVASTPSAIQSWVASTGVTFKSLDITIASVEVVNVQVGVNAVMLTAQMGSTILSSSGTIWTQSSCSGGSTAQLCL